MFRGGIGLMTQPLDQQIFENQTGNTATVPNRTTYTRLEARTLGLSGPSTTRTCFVCSRRNPPAGSLWEA